MFRYSVVENVLAKVFALPPSSMGALRGRLKNFQKMGMSAESPGSGQRVTYSVSHIYDWGLALSFAEFGVDPQVLARIAGIGTFEKLANVENMRDEDMYLLFHPKLFTRLSDTIVMRQVWKSTLMEAVQDWEGSSLAGRIGLINLTDLKRKIDEALEG